MKSFHTAYSTNCFSIFGLLFFVSMMAVGYYYNLTFVQFGLLDLGTRLVGLSEVIVARYMAILAMLTSGIAVGVGLWMQRRGLGGQLRLKLRMASGVVAAQTTLTWLAPIVRSEPGYLALITGTALALGVGVPATFSLTVDLVPVRWRGFAGALITSLAYFPAVVLSPNWTVEQFSTSIVWLMLAGSLALGCLAFLPLDLIDKLAVQHRQPAFGRGRFIRVDAAGKARIQSSLVLLFILMFGIFFVDSLGFLRLADTPFFFEAAWRSPNLAPRLTIGLAHITAALIAGVLYTALNEKELFLWIFGIFGLVHLMNSFTARGGLSGETTLGMPVLYAIAVSLYTVVNFAIWADVSTPHTISRNTALGVALSAWTATFLSTALALGMRLGGVTLEAHLRLVDSLAILFFLLVAGLIFFAPSNRNSRGRRLSEGET